MLGGEPPETPHYELFMDEHNQKISKSKGNGLTMEEWLRYGAPESLAYYMFTSPKIGQAALFRRDPQGHRRVPAAAGRLQPGAAPRARIRANPLDNPVWSVHGGEPPAQGSPVSFSLLLNLVSAANASDDRRSSGGSCRATCRARRRESEPLLDRLADYAIHYYEDFVLPAKRFRAADERGARRLRRPGWRA